MRVDGKGRYLAHVLAAGYLLVADDVRNLVGSLLHGFGIFIRQVVFGQNGVHLRVVVARLAQNVDDLADGVLGVLGPFNDFHYGLVARLAALELVFRYENVVGQCAVFRNQESIVLVHVQLAHKGVVAAFYNFDDLGLAGVSAASGQHRHAHAVAVEGAVGVALTYQYGLPAVVGQKAVAPVALAYKRTLHHLRAHGQAVVSLFVGGQIVVEHQLVEHVHRQHLGRVCRSAYFMEKVLYVIFLLSVLFKKFQEQFGYFLLGQPAAALFAFLSHVGLVLRVITFYKNSAFFVLLQGPGGLFAGGWRNKKCKFVCSDNKPAPGK